MGTPTRREIEDKATEMYLEDAQSATNDRVPTPEVNELKETGYYAKAQRELMKGSEPEESTTASSADEARQFNRERTFNPNQKGPSRFSRAGESIKRRVVPVKTVVAHQPSRALGVIKSQYRGYKKSRADQAAKMAEERAQIRTLKRKEIAIAQQQYIKGRQRGVAEFAYNAGRRKGREFISRPPPPPPLTFKGAIQIQSAHLRSQRAPRNDFDLLTGLPSSQSLLGTLGSDSEFHYFQAPQNPKRKAAPQRQPYDSILGF